MGTELNTGKKTECKNFMSINMKLDKCNAFEFVSKNVQFIVLWNCYFQPRYIELVTLKNVKYETHVE